MAERTGQGTQRTTIALLQMGQKGAVTCLYIVLQGM